MSRTFDSFPSGVWFCTITPMKFLACLSLLLSSAQFMLAVTTPPPAVPEINGSLAGSALTLTGGLLLVIRGRIKR